MKLLVTGAAGLLGSEVVAAARARALETIAAAHAELDVTDAHAVMDAAVRSGPDVIVQCAAYTDVDRSEREPDVAMAVNCDGARHAAEAARAVGARFVYVSTDYVFDGGSTRPYRSGDDPRPLSAYGRSKLAGERASTAAAPDALVVRTSWLYGGARRSFVTAMVERARAGLPLSVVADQIGGPSWAHSVAESLLDLTASGAAGVWHVADRGACSKADLAEEALELYGVEADVERISAVAWGAAAERPAYSVLDVEATEARLGRVMPDWRRSLAEFVAAELRVPEAPHGRARAGRSVS